MTLQHRPASPAGMRSSVAVLTTAATDTTAAAGASYAECQTHGYTRLFPPPTTVAPTPREPPRTSGGNDSSRRHTQFSRHAREATPPAPYVTTTIAYIHIGCACRRQTPNTKISLIRSQYGNYSTNYNTSIDKSHLQIVLCPGYIMIENLYGDHRCSTSR